MSVSVSPQNIIVTSNGSRYQKADTGKVIVGAFLGNMIGGSILKASQALFHIPINNIAKDTAAFSAKDLPPAIDAAMSKSGLVSKGLKLIDATESNSESIKNVLDKALPKWLNKFPKFKDIFINKLNAKVNIIKEGQNACFVPRANTIIINKEKMGWAAFHEIGHALNKHSNHAVIKVLRNLKGSGRLLAGVAFFTGILKRKKVEGEKPQGAWDKITTFVKDHCGAIAFVGMLPTLLEEGLASIRGSKLAKGIVSPEQLKALNKLHAKAWLTYLGTAVGFVVATTVASKIRDKIAEPKKIA